MCTPCDLLCLTCSVVSTNCTSCHSGSYLSSYSCLCNPGFYRNGVACSACSVECQTCHISAPTRLSCNGMHGTVLSGSACVCPVGKYQNSSNVCVSCHSFCSSCDGPSQTNCLSCYSSTHRTHNPTSKTCPCDSGYYSNGALLCLTCTSPCLTCNGGSIINCTSCIAGYNLIGSSCNAVVSCPSSFNYEGHCVSSCPNTTYPSAGVCLSCSGYCLTCLSASVCSSCVSPFYLLTNGTCLGHCPTGTYASNGNCLACPNGCASCVFRSTMSQVNCLTCNPSYYIWGVICSNSCPLAAQTHLIY